MQLPDQKSTQNDGDSSASPARTKYQIMREKRKETSRSGKSRAPLMINSLVNANDYSAERSAAGHMTDNSSPNRYGAAAATFPLGEEVSTSMAEL